MHYLYSKESEVIKVAGKFLAEYSKSIINPEFNPLEKTNSDSKKFRYTYEKLAVLQNMLGCAVF